MANQRPDPARERTRTQNETELARLRKLRGALPQDRHKAGRHMDSRMRELETSLSARRPGRGGGLAATMKGAIVLAGVVVVLALGFVGILMVGQLNGL